MKSNPNNLEGTSAQSQAAGKPPTGGVATERSRDLSPDRLPAGGALEAARRYRRAREMFSVASEPYFKWLAKTDILFAKITVIKDGEGKVEVNKSYPPEVERSIAEMMEVIRTIERHCYETERVPLPAANSD